MDKFRFFVPCPTNQPSELYTCKTKSWRSYTTAQTIIRLSTSTTRHDQESSLFAVVLRLRLQQCYFVGPLFVCLVHWLTALSPRRLGTKTGIFLYLFILLLLKLLLRYVDDDTFSPTKTANSTLLCWHSPGITFPGISCYYWAHKCPLRGLSICQLSIRISEVMIHLFSPDTRTIHYIFFSSCIIFAFFGAFGFFAFTCGLFPICSSQPGRFFIIF